MPDQPTYVLVTGSRRWSDYHAVLIALQNLKKLLGEFTVVQGGATGADTYAEIAATILGLSNITVPAQWKLYGRRAGPMRNIQMLEMGPAVVLGFYVHGSIGTAHTLTNAVNKYRIPTLVYTREYQPVNNPVWERIRDYA